MTPPDNQTFFLIDGPSPFAPLEELLAFRKQCKEMLVEYPDHPQWQQELEAVIQSIAERKSAI